MRGDGTKKPKKNEDLLVLLLARGWSQRQAAKAANVHESTVCEFCRDPAFRRRIDEVRNQIMSAAVGRLVGMSDKALRRLEALLECADDKIAVAALREWRACTIDFGLQHDLALRIQEASASSDDSVPGPATGPAAGEEDQSS